MGFDLLQLARFNEGRDACPGYGAFVVASKQCVLAIELDLIGRIRFADLPQTRPHKLLPWNWKADHDQALAA